MVQKGVMDNTSEFFENPLSGMSGNAGKPELIHAAPMGCCAIYKCDRGGRFRVLKCLQEEFRGNPLYETLLRKEFGIGYSLSHNHICEYYAFVQEPELGNCIEMEWVDGLTLDAYFAQEKPDKETCEKIAVELCDALSYMHSKQVVHKDLKPENILITHQGANVKLIDFGLSDTDSSTVLKGPAGTAVYAAPEVLSGGKADFRSDIYSLGAVLTLFPVRRWGPVIRRCLAADPSKRYDSVAAVRKALTRNTPVLQGVLFIMIVVAATFLPMLDRLERAEDKMQSAPVAVPSSPDTSPVPEAEDKQLDTIPVPASKPSASQPLDKKGPEVSAPKPTGKPGAKSGDKKSDNQTEMIDELFRQATEMFE